MIALFFFFTLNYDNMGLINNDNDVVWDTDDGGQIDPTVREHWGSYF